MLEVETGEHPPGTVAQVMQPGYVIADRLLRPALVGVAKAPRAQAATDAAGSADGTRDDRAAAAGRPGERLDTTA